MLTNQTTSKSESKMHNVFSLFTRFGQKSQLENIINPLFPVPEEQAEEAHTLGLTRQERALYNETYFTVIPNLCDRCTGAEAVGQNWVCDLKSIINTMAYYKAHNYAYTLLRLSKDDAKTATFEDFTQFRDNFRSSYKVFKKYAPILRAFNNLLCNTFHEYALYASQHMNQHTHQVFMKIYSEILDFTHYNEATTRTVGIVLKDNLYFHTATRRMANKATLFNTAVYIALQLLALESYDSLYINHKRRMYSNFCDISEDQIIERDCQRMFDTGELEHIQPNGFYDYGI